VAVLFASDVDLFLTKLTVLGREVGGDRRRVLTFPSDALLGLW
jgi:hypothetical protein